MSAKILFLDHAAVLGGGELSLLTIATHFRDRAAVVLFEDGPFRTRLESAGVDVRVVPMPGSVGTVGRDSSVVKDLASVPGLVGYCRKISKIAKDFDIVYANSQKSMVVGALAGKLARRKVVWHLRDLLTEAHFSPTHIRIGVGISNQMIDRVVANSESTRSAFVEAGGSEEKAVTIYNGIETVPFDNLESTTKNSIREEFRIGSESKVVGCFSRLSDWKGQHVLLDAIRKEPNIVALLVGEALFETDKSYEKTLRQLVARHGMDDRVHFLGFRRDVPALMAACDVVAHTSTAPEPFGRVIIEGMLAGTPVVAAAAGGAVELIEHSTTGLLVPPSDSSALHAALVEILGNESLYANIKENAGVVAREQFSSDRMLAEIEALVDSQF